jgi:dynein heavy chain 2
MNFGRDVEGQLESYTSVDLGEAEGDDEAQVLDLKLKALILDTIHNMDVIHELLKANVKNPGEWIWQKQLRSVRYVRN